MEKSLNSVGPFGKYQKFVLFLTAFASSLTAAIIYSTVFTSADPGLICSFKNGSVEINKFPEPCKIWSKIKQSEKSNISTLYECHFDRKYYDLTIVNEWELICDKKYLAGLTQTINLIGKVSGLFIGYFSDRFGRKQCAFVLALLLSLVLILSQLFQFRIFNLENSTMYIIYCVVQFILGALSKSMYSVIYILLLEITTSKYSTMVSNIFSYFYVLGELMVLIVAYFFRNWHIINVSMAAYSIIFVIVIWFFVPESPRYLISMKYYDKALELFRKMARFNGQSAKDLPENSSVLQKIMESEKLNEQKFNKENQLHLLEDQSKMKYLLKKENLIKTILFVYLWLAINLIYLGISLGKNITFNFIF